MVWILIVGALEIYLWEQPFHPLYSVFIARDSWTMNVWLDVGECFSVVLTN